MESWGALKLKIELPYDLVISIWGISVKKTKTLTWKPNVHCSNICSVARLCLTLCNPMDWGTPGSSVLHYLPKLCPLNWWCYLTISSPGAPFFCLQYFPASGSFPRSQLFSSSGESAAASASASVLPKNIQGWFPLGLIGLISLLPKGLSIQLWCPSITIQNHQLFSIHLLYNPTLTSIHDQWKKHGFDYMDLCQQSDVSAF